MLDCSKPRPMDRQDRIINAAPPTEHLLVFSEAVFGGSLKRGG